MIHTVMPPEIESNPRLMPTTNQALRDIRAHMKDANPTRIEAFNNYSKRVNAAMRFFTDNSEPIWVRERRLWEIDDIIKHKIKNDGAFKQEYEEIVGLGSRLQSALEAEAKTSNENSILVLRERKLRKIKDEINRSENQQIETPLREKILTPIREITHQVFRKND